MVGIDTVVWKTLDYMSARVPAAGGGLAPVMLPAIRIRARPHDRMPWTTGIVKAHAVGIIDSGAVRSAIPMWMLDKLGIATDTMVPAYSASGQLRAYKTMIGMEINHNNRWQDLGAVDVLVPDTEGSRIPYSGFNPLLGLDGFFDRLSVCIDHSARTFQLGRAGGWT